MARESRAAERLVEVASEIVRAHSRSPHITDMHRPNDPPCSRAQTHGWRRRRPGARRRIWQRLIVLLAGLGLGTLAHAATAPPHEPELDGMQLSVDEHLLSDAPDHNYAGGGAISASGSFARHDGLDTVLGAIDRFTLGYEDRATELAPPWHALAVGMLVFTPRNLRRSRAIPGERPYASLVFASTGRRYLERDGAVSYQSDLMFGMLGLAAVGQFQNALHRLTQSQRAYGWGQQISAGGEPTAGYSLSRAALLAGEPRGAHRYDLHWTAAASVGTITEGSLALALRWGRIESPWWANAPEQNLYVQETHPLPPPLPRGAPPELFVLLGVRLTARLYNAFLEGQFRHSAVRYSFGDLNPLLGDAWAGFEFRTHHLAIRYLIRWESPELRSGTGAHSFFWGNVEITVPLGG